MSNRNYTSTEMNAKGHKTSSSLKYMKKLAEGTVLTFVAIDRTGSYEDDFGNTVLSHKIVFKSNKGENIKVPVAEYNKFIFGDSQEAQAEEGDVIVLPKSVTIQSSEDRTTQAGEVMWNIAAYELGNEFMNRKQNGSEITMSDVFASPLLDDASTKYDPIQTYSVSTQF